MNTSLMMRFVYVAIVSLLLYCIHTSLAGMSMCSVSAELTYK